MRYAGFFRFLESNTLERTALFGTEADALIAVQNRMNGDPSIKEGYVCKIMSKSVRVSSIETTDYGE